MTLRLKRGIADSQQNTKLVFLRTKYMKDIYVFKCDFFTKVSCGFLSPETMEKNCQNQTMSLQEECRYLPQY